MTLEEISALSPSAIFYNLKDKLINHATKRSFEQFDIADKERNSIKTKEEFLTYKLNKMNLKEDFEYIYDYETDTSILSYTDMQSRFLVYRIKVSESIEGIDQLSFEERVKADDNYVEGWEQFIPGNFLPF